MTFVLITTLGILIGRRHGISAKKLMIAHEYFDGPTEVTIFITYARQTTYSITILGSFILNSTLNADVTLMTWLWKEVDINAMGPVSRKIKVIIICPWHGISARKLNLVLEYFDGQMVATTIIIYERQLMYLITILGFYISILSLDAEVKSQYAKFMNLRN